MPDSLHVAIIMDGNGRWAHQRNLPRKAGHSAGAQALLNTIEAAGARDIHMLTVYAFSSDNWNRPSKETHALMTLIRTRIRREMHRCQKENIRLSVIGRRDRLPNRLVETICEAEELTRDGALLHLRLAVDYSGRHALEHAARYMSGNGHGSFSHALGKAYHTRESASDVDLLIRTGGEKRLSDFLLWECAYAELYFTDCWWPDFGAQELDLALGEFRRRQRRFGCLPSQCT
ncbi:MAG: polyprenyl diphosphate synthase [Bacteroidota bacterium]|nr:polyprenyl diphosphate synthase [Bacteroidota bacterium]